MAEKSKNLALPSKTNKTKRPSTVNAATTSRKVPSTVVKDVKIAAIRPRTNRNTTIIGDLDITFAKTDSANPTLPDFDSEHRQIAYGKFLRAMLEDCLVEEKIEREETQLDVQMAQLADRFRKTMEQLDKTSKRLKDISFVVEQKRLLDLKSKDCSRFYEITENSNAEEILGNLAKTEQSYLDKLETRNIDFGYDKETGHKKLLDAVNDALEGLEQIKQHSNLDLSKFEEYAKAQHLMEKYEKDRSDVESLKAEFETKFPKLNEKLLQEASQKLANVIAEDEDSDE